MDTPPTLCVAAEHADQTVLSLLRTLLPGESWSRLRTLIESRRVAIDGVLCVQEARRLKAGETVTVHDQPLAAPPQDQQMRIVHRDEQVVVVEKPSGMATLRRFEERHWPERRKRLAPTLDEAVARLLAPRTNRGRASASPLFAVQRLDRDTSGVLVFARTVAARDHLIRQFAAHSVHRVYVAVVEGMVTKRTIRSHLVRDRGDGRRGSGPADQGELAITHVTPVESLGDYTLVECRLKTGRTHQIRIHLSEAGHPVCGDVKYGRNRPAGSFSDGSGAPRLALHARELGFLHPTTGQRADFMAPPPEDLARWIETLRRAASAR